MIPYVPLTCHFGTMKVQAVTLMLMIHVVANGVVLVLVQHDKAHLAIYENALPLVQVGIVHVEQEDKVQVVQQLDMMQVEKVLVGSVNDDQYLRHPNVHQPTVVDHDKQGYVTFQIEAVQLAVALNHSLPKVSLLTKVDHAPLVHLSAYLLYP